MADYENPAGRLHELLTRFGSASNSTILAAWAGALEVEQSEVKYHHGHVAILLEDVRKAAEETGSFDGMPGHLDGLARSIFPVDQPFSATVAHVTPDANAMQLLEALSYALRLSGSEVTIPEDDELDALKKSVRDLIDEVRDGDLPPEVRRALLHRLAEMLEALELLVVGGPDAVRRAAEALAMTAAMHTDADDPDTIRRIFQVARKAFTAFTVTTAIAGYAVTWERIGELTGVLGQGQEQRQLEPPQHPAGEEPQPPHAPENT